MNAHQSVRRVSAPGSQEVLLELRGVAKTFGKLEVVRSVDLDVREQEILGLIGPNGAGKSTLFNIISGVLAPSNGSIKFAGRDLVGVSAADRAKSGIGRTYQIPMPFRSMTVFENLLTAAIHGGRTSLPKARALCEEILCSTGLMRCQNQAAGMLPLLDLKRLELARALCLRPRLLLLDEVAGGLTDGECEVLVDLIRATNARGVTVVWVEHVLNALSRVATRLAMLSEGRILIDGNFDDVISDPSVRVAYLGS